MTGTWWGLVLGVGVFLVWMAWWRVPDQGAVRHGAWWARTQDKLVLAGMPHLSPAGLAGLAAAAAAVVGILMMTLTTSVAVGGVFALLAARGPYAVVSGRARRRMSQLRDVWPEAVDHLVSGIRAGLSLPEALSDLGERGPAQVRTQFRQFAHDYRASGRFHDCLDGLKARLADPVADRIIEALRVTRDVGGTDIGKVLRTLAEFLRDDARTRHELEARQSWTVNAARLAAAAPWVVLALLSTQPGNAQAYNSAAGVVLLVFGAGATVVAYRLMMTIGRLPQDVRVLR